MNINSRQVALDIIIEVMENEGFVHVLLNQALSKYAFIDKRERSFITRLTKGTIEQVILLDYIIDQYSKMPVHKMKPFIRNVLRMTVYQLKDMKSVPDMAACNESVKLVKQRGLHMLSGFVNGVSRNIARGLPQLNIPKDLSLQYSMPKWILDEWGKRYTEEEITAILESFQDEGANGTCVRILGNVVSRNIVPENKVSKEELLIILQSEGISYREHEFLNHCIYISNFDSLEKTKSFQNGYYQVQDSASILLGELLPLKKGNKCLDMCAAPGGKTIMMADIIGETGQVISRDVSYEKCALIEENRMRCHFDTIQIEEFDALVYDSYSKNQYDLVLVDAPCSGLGIIGSKPDIKYKMTKEKQVQLQQLQRSILKNAMQYVKDDGYLVYSTCTISPYENEDNVDFILEQKEFVQHRLKAYLPEKLAEKIDDTKGIQLLPGIHKSEGFFISIFHKEGGGNESR